MLLRKTLRGFLIAAAAVVVLAPTVALAAAEAPAAYAAVAQACPYNGSLACADPYTPVNMREGTDTASTIVGVLYPGQIVGFCQILGQDIGGNSIWDWIGNDSSGIAVYVSDYYMNTSSYGTNMVFPCPNGIAPDYGKGT